MSGDYKLGYAFGSRWVEKMLAFGLALFAALWLAIHIRRFSQHAFEGLFYGVLASFFINGFCRSVFVEGNLIMLAMIVIGISLGWAALGMGIAGWLLFNSISTLLVVTANYLVFREGK